MEALIHEGILLFSAIAGSTGLWSFIASSKKKKSAMERMILGLGHDRIIYLCEKHLEKKFITPDALENLHDYLYVPYRDMGGNGSAKKYMEDVMKLPPSAPVKTEHPVVKKRIGL